MVKLLIKTVSKVAGEQRLFASTPLLKVKDLGGRERLGSGAAPKGLAVGVLKWKGQER